MNTQTKILQNYKTIRSDYLDSEAEAHQKFISDLFIHRYYPHIKHNKKAKILEIGCNKGYMLNALKANGFTQLHGIDLCHEDVEMAKKRTGLTEIHCQDAFDYLKNRQEKFDVIIAKDVMEHISKDKQEDFVRTIYNNLIYGGGITLIQVPNMDWLFSNHERYMDFTHEIGYTRESFGDIFRLYFEEVKVEPASYIFTNTLKRKIVFGIIRRVMLKILRMIFKILGEGASDVWFEHREIMVIATNCHPDVRRDL